MRNRKQTAAFSDLLDSALAIIVRNLLGGTETQEKRICHFIKKRRTANFDVLSLIVEDYWDGGSKLSIGTKRRK